MPKTFFDRINRLIDRANVLIEVLDSRFPDLTRNLLIERKILNSKKILVFVLNKSDLISKSKAESEKRKLENVAPAIFVSAKEKMGSNRLRSFLEILRKKNNLENIVVGVLGYPNVGKSSVVNALTGRHSAKTSIKAGFTRGEQFVRLSDTVLLIDSPGIIPIDEKDEFFLALIAARNPDKLSDCEGIALKLIDFLKESDSKQHETKRFHAHHEMKDFMMKFEKKFGIKAIEMDSEKILEEIALKRKKLLKGGIPDTETVARQLILEWQKGKI